MVGADMVAAVLVPHDHREAAWEIVDPVLGDVVPVHPYPPGSWGPKEAERLLPARDTWHDPVS
jgi:glucose-6-phosphate 1-dehydrogenase